LHQWRTGCDFADAILARLLKSSSLGESNRAFATELFYGILRNLSVLDFWIASVRPARLHSDVRDLLRLGFYQLFLLDTPEHAAVYETVALAGARTRSLVNAVLRRAIREKNDLAAEAREQDLSVRYSHPQFLLDRWTQNFGAENTVALCEWNNNPAQVYARINRLNISVTDFFLRYPDAERIARHDSFARLRSVPHDALAKGHCYIQDPSTTVACLLLDPKPNEKILDACAAPGGKTGYLAELMKDKGAIMAFDRDPRRIGTLQENLERLGTDIVSVAQHDWTSDTPPFARISPISFDRVLLDAPCSNTGVMRRRVDLRWRLVPKDFLRMQNEQVRMLRTILPLLKPGGILVYSTCSIEPEENEMVVDIITKEFSFLETVEQQTLFPFRDRFDGAFAAKLQRKE